MMVASSSTAPMPAMPPRERKRSIFARNKTKSSEASTPHYVKAREMYGVPPPISTQCKSAPKAVPAPLKLSDSAVSPGSPAYESVQKAKWDAEPEWLTESAPLSPGAAPASPTAAAAITAPPPASAPESIPSPALAVATTPVEAAPSGGRPRRPSEAPPLPPMLETMPMPRPVYLPSAPTLWMEPQPHEISVFEWSPNSSPSTSHTDLPSFLHSHHSSSATPKVAHTRSVAAQPIPRKLILAAGEIKSAGPASPKSSQPLSAKTSPTAPQRMGDERSSHIKSFLLPFWDSNQSSPRHKRSSSAHHSEKESRASRPGQQKDRAVSASAARSTGPLEESPARKSMEPTRSQVLQRVASKDGIAMPAVPAAFKSGTKSALSPSKNGYPGMPHVKAVVMPRVSSDIDEPAQTRLSAFEQGKQMAEKSSNPRFPMEYKPVQKPSTTPSMPLKSALKSSMRAPAMDERELSEGADGFGGRKFQPPLPPSAALNGPSMDSGRSPLTARVGDMLNTARRPSLDVRTAAQADSPRGPSLDLRSKFSIDSIRRPSLEVRSLQNADVKRRPSVPATMGSSQADEDRRRQSLVEVADALANGLKQTASLQTDVRKPSVACSEDWDPFGPSQHRISDASSTDSANAIRLQRGPVSPTLRRMGSNTLPTTPPPTRPLPPVSLSAALRKNSDDGSYTGGSPVADSFGQDFGAGATLPSRGRSMSSSSGPRRPSVNNHRLSENPEYQSLINALFPSLGPRSRQDSNASLPRTGYPARKASDASLRTPLSPKVPRSRSDSTASFAARRLSAFAPSMYSVEGEEYEEVNAVDGNGNSDESLAFGQDDVLMELSLNSPTRAHQTGAAPAGLGLISPNGTVCASALARLLSSSSQTSPIMASFDVSAPTSPTWSTPSMVPSSTFGPRETGNSTPSASFSPTSSSASGSAQTSPLFANEGLESPVQPKMRLAAPAPLTVNKKASAALPQTQKPASPTTKEVSPRKVTFNSMTTWHHFERA